MKKGSAHDNPSLGVCREAGGARRTLRIKRIQKAREKRFGKEKNECKANNCYNHPSVK